MTVAWVKGRLKILKLDERLLEKVKEGSMSISAAKRALILTPRTQEGLAQRETVSIKDVEGIRRAERLELLDLDSIEVPTGPNFAYLASQLQAVANEFSGRKQQTLLAAARILESIGNR